MIVQESDRLLQALDRRLQIDRIDALEPIATVASAEDDSPAGAGRASAAPVALAQQSTLAARLPLGRIVPARVVEIPDADHVVADVEQWRVVLAWPRGASALLRPGQDIALRVLAHQPMLLFQSVDASGEALATGDAALDAPTRWSQNALELARQASTRPARDAGGTLRFTEPMIEVELRASDAQAATTATATDSIRLDDVIVAQAATNAAQTRVAVDPNVVPMPMPILLQGPAWPGQPLELVVRRERADDEFDNAALDQWCGELVIDLPALGRVSGHLSFSMQGLRIRLEGEDDATVASMSAASASLAAALADADLRVAALSVGCPGTGRHPAAAHG